MSEYYQYRCCGCECIVEKPDDLKCPECGCELEIDVDYYIQHAEKAEAELEKYKIIAQKIAKLHMPIFVYYEIKDIYDMAVTLLEKEVE
jgi:hypothetical protein